MKEPCRSCDDKQTCFGGCRCQAYLLSGDPANADPACNRSPHHHVIAAAVAEAQRPRHFRQPLVYRQAGAVTSTFLESGRENAP